MTVADETTETSHYSWARVASSPTSWAWEHRLGREVGMRMRMGNGGGRGGTAGHWQEHAVPSKKPRVPLRRGREIQDRVGEGGV